MTKKTKKQQAENNEQKINLDSSKKLLLFRAKSGIGW